MRGLGTCPGFTFYSVVHGDSMGTSRYGSDEINLMAVNRRAGGALR